MNKNDLHRLDLVLAVEIDPSASAPDRSPTRILESRQAEELGVRLTADLGDLLSGVQRFGLVQVGALYDQTQVLQPGFPLYDALADVYARSDSQGAFNATTLTVGARDGDLGSEQLMPGGAAGLLMLWPITLLSPDPEAVADMATRAETTFIERGQVSPATALALQQAFGLAIPHARFMTLNDLCAMLRLQLEHIGLAELWDLLDAALFTPDRCAYVQTPGGNGFAVQNGQLHALVHSFDEWARSGGGQSIQDTGRGELSQGYAGYLRVLRQVMLSMAAHGVPCQVHPWTGDLPADAAEWAARSSDAIALDGPVLREPAIDGPADGPLRVTVHANDEMGLVAYTLEWVDAGGQVIRRENLIPVHPEGLGEIQTELESRAEGALELAWPGCISYHPEQRCLVGDPQFDEGPPNWH